MKLIFIFLFLSMSSFAIASLEQAAKVQELAKDCLKSQMNIEMAAAKHGFSTSFFDSLSGDYIAKMEIKDVSKSATIIYQTLDEKIIILQITGTSESGGYNFSGLSHEGPNGCEQYKP